jgi:ferredoxin
MRIHLDADRCTGHGRCYALAPSLFDADDDDGHGVPRTEVVGADGAVPPELEEDARKAVLNCPERAITIVG